MDQFMTELQGSIGILKNPDVVGYLLGGLAFTLGISLITIVLSLLIGAVLAAVSGRFALKPIRTLIAQMQHLASGDLQARLEFHEPYAHIPAYAELSDGFNKMAQELPQKEFQLLYKLLSYPGKIFTRIQLMDEIWGLSSETGWETVTVHIGRLRRRFEGWDEFEIESVRGLGYKAVKKV